MKPVPNLGPGTCPTCSLSSSRERGCAHPKMATGGATTIPASQVMCTSSYLGGVWPSVLYPPPPRYHVRVEASSGAGWVASEPRRIRVQRRVVANRLVSAASALVNTSVAFECRINFGTDVVYLWHFGDGTIALGSSSSSHIYRR